MCWCDINDVGLQKARVSSVSFSLGISGQHRFIWVRGICGIQRNLLPRKPIPTSLQNWTLPLYLSFGLERCVNDIEPGNQTKVAFDRKITPLSHVSLPYPHPRNVTVCSQYVHRSVTRRPLRRWYCRYSLGNMAQITLQWRHNGNDSVSNHQPHDCLLNCLFRRRWKKTSKLRVTGLCVVNSSVIGEFSAQMASNGENVSIWWRHNEARSSREWQSEVEDLLWNCGTLIHVCPAENPTGLNLIYQLYCTYRYLEIRKHRIKLRAQDPLPYHLVICFVDF